MNEKQALPSRDEIDVFNSLDGAVACRNFLGKSLAEAEALFRENSICYVDDLLWMGPVAFQFYIHAAIAYVKSEHAAEDSGIINCLAGTLGLRLEWEPDEMTKIAGLLAEFCSYVLNHFERFDADPTIYGDLRGKYAALASAFQRLAHGETPGV